MWLQQPRRYDPEINTTLLDRKKALFLVPFEFRNLDHLNLPNLLHSSPKGLLIGVAVPLYIHL